MNLRSWGLGTALALALVLSAGLLPSAIGGSGEDKQGPPAPAWLGTSYNEPNSLRADRPAYQGLSASSAEDSILPEDLSYIEEPCQSTVRDAQRECTEWLSWAGTSSKDWVRDSILLPDGETLVLAGMQDDNDDQTGSIDAEESKDRLVVAKNAGTGATEWTYTDDFAQDYDTARSVASDPAGDTVYVAGWSWDRGVEAFENYMVLTALDAETGQEEWTRTVSDSDLPFEWISPTRPEYLREQNMMREVVASEDKVFLVATSAGAPQSMVAIAFDGGDGSMEWHSVYKPNLFDSRANAAVLSPDGETLYVGGAATFWDDPTCNRIPCSDIGWVIRAYDTASGAVEWTTVHNPVSEYHNREVPFGAALDAKAETLYVVGHSWGDSKASGPVAQILALDAENGQTAWGTPITEAGTSDDGTPSILEDVTVAPDGDRVFAVGTTTEFKYPHNAEDHLLTASFDAVSGETDWVTRTHRGPPDTGMRGFEIEVGPQGENVYTGSLAAGHGPVLRLEGTDGIYWGVGTFGKEHSVGALDARSGETKWQAMLSTVSNSYLYGLDLGLHLSPSGDQVYLVGNDDLPDDSAKGGQTPFAAAYPADGPDVEAWGPEVLNPLS